MKRLYAKDLKKGDIVWYKYDAHYGNPCLCRVETSTRVSHFITFDKNTKKPVSYSSSGGGTPEDHGLGIFWEPTPEQKVFLQDSIVKAHIAMHLYTPEIYSDSKDIKKENNTEGYEIF